MLEIKDLVVKYGQAITAVDSVSIDVPEGRLVAIVGANGAGKTSLLSAVAGLVRPFSGSISLLGADVTRLPSHKRFASGVVLVPEGRAILTRMSVEENLRLVTADPEQAFDRFPALKARWTMSAGTLSGGEQQMLALARGLLSDPKILLLDEPSLGLAPIMVGQIFELIEELREAGTTVLLVEQNARKALTIADYGYVLDTGKVVLHGPGRELAEDDAIVDAYLGGAALSA